MAMLLRPTLIRKGERIGLLLQSLLDKRYLEEKQKLAGVDVK